MKYLRGQEGKAYAAVQRERYQQRKRHLERTSQRRLEISVRAFMQLRREIQRFDIGRFPGVDESYGIIEQLLGEIDGKLEPVSLSTHTGKPIYVAKYGKSDYVSGRVNVVHPSEPWGLRGLFVELQMCKHDPSMLKKIQRREIPILDVDGYQLQEWVNTPLPEDPKQALLQYIFGFERPHDGGGYEYQFRVSNSPGSSVDAQSFENLAIKRFIEENNLTCYTSRHAYGLERGPLFGIRPYFGSGEFRALSMAAGMSMVEMETEEPFESIFPGEDAIFIRYGADVVNEYHARTSGEVSKQTHTFVVDPFLRANPQGAFAICDQPLFLVRGTPGVPTSLTKAEVLERSISLADKMHRPIHEYLEASKAKTVGSDQFASPLWEAYDRYSSLPERRFFASALQQWNLSKLVLSLFKQEQLEMSDPQAIAPPSFTYHYLYGKRFYDILRVSLVKRAIAFIEGDSFDVCVQLEKLIEGEVTQMCKDLTIQVSTPEDQILMSMGTTQITEDFALGRLSNPDLARHLSL